MSDIVTVPGRMSGQPVITGTRITVEAVKSLAGRGFSTQRIANMYGVEASLVDSAIGWTDER